MKELAQKEEEFQFDIITVDSYGKEINRVPSSARQKIENLGNDVILEMVYIPRGVFIMGAPATEKNANYDETPQHKVTVKSFFMGKYPITQAQWRAVSALPKINRDLEPELSLFKGDNLPVEKVSWYDAIEFCTRLSRHTGKKYRLPSEAEWEYACRDETTTPFCFGETITSDLANYNASYTYGFESQGEYRQQTTPVGLFPPNPRGLYDIHGNVWEWCLDDWHCNYNGAPTDNSAWTDTINYRVLRGGSWNSKPNCCRSAYRFRYNPNFKDVMNGFRVVHPT